MDMFNSKLILYKKVLDQQDIKLIHQARAGFITTMKPIMHHDV